MTDDGQPGKNAVEVGPLLAYEARGSGKPVVFLHGLTASGRWWSQNTPVLARHFRVYSIDLTGFGDSRDHGVFDLDEAVPRIMRRLDALQLNHFSIVGHSMGGLIAARIAALHPDRVDRLVLVDAAVLAFDRGLGRRIVGLVKSISRLPRQFAPMMAEDTLRANPKSLRRATMQLLTTDGRDDLKRITAPTLIIWGERDTIVPLVVGEQIRDQIAGSRLLVIPGSSHTPMLDQPLIFNDEVIRFLNEPAAAPSSNTRQTDMDQKAQ